MKLLWQGWPERPNRLDILISGDFYIYVPPHKTARYVTIRDRKRDWHVLHVDADEESLEELQAAAEVLLDVVKIRYQEELAKCPPLSNES